MTYMDIYVVKRVWSVVPEPVVQRDRDFTEVFLRECVLVPDDQFEDAELVCEGDVQWEVEHSVL